MGCNGSKSVATVLAEHEGDASTRPVTPQPQQQIPPSMAFDIPFEESGESIVKRHPPKRLQRLEEQQQNNAPVSLQDIQEKQEEADARRQQFLQLRAQSAKRKYAMRTQDSKQDNEEDPQPETEEAEETQPQ